MDTHKGRDNPSADKAKQTDGSKADQRGGWELTRRGFVTTVGVLTGGVALGMPIPDSPTMFAGDKSSAENPVTVKMHINGRRQTLSLDPRVTLLDLLCEVLALTGTKRGCDHGQCGACTVLVNRRRINSCLSLAVVHHGDEITTIEGLAKGDELHPLQAAFLEHDGFQCGYCTPGQICSAVGLLREAEKGEASVVTGDLTQIAAVELTAEEIRERMSGNICRCGAYSGIVEAVQQVHRQGNAV